MAAASCAATRFFSIHSRHRARSISTIKGPTRRLRLPSIGDSLTKWPGIITASTKQEAPARSVLLRSRCRTSMAATRRFRSGIRSEWIKEKKHEKKLDPNLHSRDGCCGGDVARVRRRPYPSAGCRRGSPQNKVRRLPRRRRQRRDGGGEGQQNTRSWIGRSAGAERRGHDDDHHQWKRENAGLWEEPEARSVKGSSHVHPDAG